MIREAIKELKKYTLGRKNTEKVEVSVLNLNRIIFALEESEPMLDKIRAEIIENSIEDYKYHGCGSDELIIGTNEVLKIIDKYKASPTGEEGSKE